MYAQVVVLTYQPPEIDSYTYKVPKDFEKQIKIGQLVEVPFGKRSPMGLVITLSHSPLAIDQKVEIKEISRIISLQPILLPYQIELLKWMSFYYMAPMVNCLEAMLPEIPSAKHLESHSRLAIDHSTRSTNTQSLKPKATILVLVPSINRLLQTMAQFKNAKNYVIYHNELKVSERFNAWMKILSGQTDYVFGSRSAIFTPCPNLAKIIIFDEHDGVYKDERSPYFDTLTVAEKISSLTKAKIEIVDASPRITTYATYKKDIKSQTVKPKTEIVSMQDERASGNKSPISNLLEEYLIYASKRNKKVLLFLNKKKESGHLFCRSCKVSAFVPKIPKVCPNCQSPDFYFSSLNIYSLKDEVKKILPSSEFIEIETVGALYKPILSKYDLIVHIFVDSLIGIADYASEEKLFCQIADLKSLLSPTGLLLIQTYNPNNPTLNLIIQNDYQKFYKNQIDLRRKLHYPPFALLVKLSKRGRDEEKLLKESNELVRKINNELLVLPAPRLSEGSNVEGSTINLGPQSKTRTASSAYKPLTIMGPYKPIFWSKTITYNIMLKYKLDSYSLSSREVAMKNLVDFLSYIPNHWKITIEPDTLN